MARMVGTQNQVVWLFESGTFANASGNGWPGLVQSINAVPTEGTYNERYLGGAGRDTDLFFQGPQSFNVSMVSHPQHFRHLAWAAGSNVDAGSPSPYTHVITPIDNNVQTAFTSGPLNPFLSFGLEESNATPGTGTNWVRTFKGAVVNTYELTGTMGEILTETITSIAVSGAWSSGAPTTFNAFTYGTGTLGSITDRPYVFNDVTVQIPSGAANIYETLTGFSFKLSNSLETRFYMTGSRTPAAPQPTYRDITLDLTFDAQSERAKTLYETYYAGGSEFNTMLFIAAGGAGSRDCAIILSGCRIMDNFESPLQRDGINPNTIYIMAKDMVANVNDLVQRYNPY